jgi:hypothetical protein
MAPRQQRAGAGHAPGSHQRRGGKRAATGRCTHRVEMAAEAAAWPARGRRRGDLDLPLPPSSGDAQASVEPARACVGRHRETDRERVPESSVRTSAVRPRTSLARSSVMPSASVTTKRPRTGSPVDLAEIAAGASARTSGGRSRSPAQPMLPRWSRVISRNPERADRRHDAASTRSPLGTRLRGLVGRARPACTRAAAKRRGSREGAPCARQSSDRAGDAPWTGWY